VVLFFPWMRIYHHFDHSNWRYLDVFRDDIWEDLLKANDCTMYFDDVIVQLFDSYEKTNFAKYRRQWAFTTRHYNRTIVLVTQRTSQIQVALRSQVNRFYRCDRFTKFPLIFRVTEFQEMKDENVDLDKPSGRHRYHFASKQVLNAYSTHGLRPQGLPDLSPVIRSYRLHYWDKLKHVFYILSRRS